MHLIPCGTALSTVMWLAVLLCETAVGEKEDKTKNEYKDGKKDFTQSQREAMLVAHNKFRRDFAKKQNAANMRLMEWDCGLEDFAFRYLLSVNCQVKHSPSSDRKDKSKTGFEGFTGENLYNQGAGYPENINWTKVAQLWYDEIQYWHYDKLGKDCQKGKNKWGKQKVCGHFTQMIWHSAYKLGCAGCGGWGYPDANSNKYTIACIYGKGGNIKDTYPFAKGTMCSSLDDPAATHVVDGLCSTQTHAPAFPECSLVDPVAKDAQNGGAEPMPSHSLLAVMVIYCCLCLASVTAQ